MILNQIIQMGFSIGMPAGPAISMHVSPNEPSEQIRRNRLGIIPTEYDRTADGYDDRNRRPQESVPHVRYSEQGEDFPGK